MKTIRYLFQVERREINYIQSIIESYDGMAGVSTADPFKAVLEVRISPGCETQFSELLKSLREKEGMEIKQLPTQLRNDLSQRRGKALSH